MTEQTEAIESQIEANDPIETKKKGNAGRGFLGIFVFVLAAATAVFAYFRDHEVVQDLMTKDEWVTRLIGNLHPILMLLPLGLILFVLLAEVLGWLSFKKWKPLTVLALFLIVITTVLASISGLVLMNLEGNTGSDWNQYLWFGIGAMGAFALSFLCKTWGRNRNSSGIFFALLFLGGVAALGYGGYIYGQKVHSYTVVPTAGKLTTPFGNQKARAEMSASIAELEQAKIESQEAQAKQEEDIALIDAAKIDAENKLSAERQKVAKAQKDIADLNKGIEAAKLKATEAEKKAAEVQKKLEAGNAEKQKFQEEVKALKSEMEALKKSAQDASKASESEAAVEEEPAE